MNNGFDTQHTLKLYDNLRNEADRMIEGCVNDESRVTKDLVSILTDCEERKCDAQSIRDETLNFLEKKYLRRKRWGVVVFSSRAWNVQDDDFHVASSKALDLQVAAVSLGPRNDDSQPSDDVTKRFDSFQLTADAVWQVYEAAKQLQSPQALFYDDVKRYMGVHGQHAALAVFRETSCDSFLVSGASVGGPAPLTFAVRGDRALGERGPYDCFAKNYTAIAFRRSTTWQHPPTEANCGSRAVDEDYVHLRSPRANLYLTAETPTVEGSYVIGAPKRSSGDDASQLWRLDADGKLRNKLGNKCLYVPAILTNADVLFKLYAPTLYECGSVTTRWRRQGHRLCARTADLEGNQFNDCLLGPLPADPYVRIVFPHRTASSSHLAWLEWDAECDYTVEPLGSIRTLRNRLFGKYLSTQGDSAEEGASIELDEWTGKKGQQWRWIAGSKLLQNGHGMCLQAHRWYLYQYACDPLNPAQRWTLNGDGQLVNDHGYCASVQRTRDEYVLHDYCTLDAGSLWTYES